MMPQNEDGRRAPSPEQLAAYADGELDCPELAPLKCRVEEWLALHPEAAAEVEGQRRLAHLWQATTPAEPAESAWTAILQRLERLPAPRPVAGPRWWPAAWVAGILAACAAALWLTVVLLQSGNQPELADRKQQRPAPPGKTKGEPKLAPVSEEPFEVARGDEIEILSIRGGDTGTLPVGEVPVRGNLVLPVPGEVEVQRTDSELRVGGSPMIWTPLANERDDPD
jgi:hypothetical protein